MDSEDIEAEMSKVLRLYSEFTESPTEDLASDIETRLDCLRLHLGIYFSEFSHLARIQRRVCSWLDQLEQDQSDWTPTSESPEQELGL